MKINCFNKGLGYIVSFILIILIMTFGIFLVVKPQVDAASSNSLVVEDYSTENAIITRYSNIQGFLRANQPKTRSSSRNIELLYDALNISKDDLSGIDESSLLNAKSIVISDTLMIANQNGSVQTLAIPYENAKNFPDITNDNGNNGYMSGRIVVIQDPTYDKVLKNKDGEITKFYAYGFECAFYMDWLKLPTYTMKDYFTFCASGGAFTETDNSCTFLADGFIMDMQNPQYNRNFVAEPEVATYYSGGWPVSSFNLPSHTSSPLGSTTYSNYRMSARARLYAYEDFNIIMSYAHKQLVLGDLSVSISTSGPSISFSGTSHREYQTPNFFIDLIKDPEMEALKE